MTDNPIIPLGQFSAHCPQCGAILKIERDTESSGIELKGDERLLCPTHGNVMSLEEARRAVLEENRDNIIDEARNVARDLLRDAFKK